MPPLSRNADGTWSFTVFPAKEENITFALAVDGRPVASRVLQVSGRSPFSVDTSSSLAAATLLSQGLTVNEPLDSATNTIIFTQEASVVSVPAYDVFGSTYPSDPGLKVRLTLVPLAMEAQVLSAYGLTPPAGVNATAVAAPAPQADADAAVPIAVALALAVTVVLAVALACYLPASRLACAAAHVHGQPVDGLAVPGRLYRGAARCMDAGAALGAAARAGFPEARA